MTTLNGARTALDARWRAALTGERVMVTTATESRVLPVSRGSRSSAALVVHASQHLANATEPIRIRLNVMKNKNMIMSSLLFLLLPFSETVRAGHP